MEYSLAKLVLKTDILFPAVAVRRLLAAMRGEEDDQSPTVLPTELILRESA